MAKMRIFKFLKDDKETEEIESSSFKKAVKSFQNKVKQSNKEPTIHPVVFRLFSVAVGTYRDNPKIIRIPSA